MYCDKFPATTAHKAINLTSACLRGSFTELHGGAQNSKDRTDLKQFPRFTWNMKTRTVTDVKLGHLHRPMSSDRALRILDASFFSGRDL